MSRQPMRTAMRTLIAAVALLAIGGCAVGDYGPDAAVFRAGVASTDKLARAHYDYRLDAAARTRNLALAAQGARLEASDACLAPGRQLQRSAACAARWVEFHDGGDAGVAPGCPEPVDVLRLAPAAALDCRFGTRTGERITALEAPRSVLAVAVELSTDLGAYADALNDVASARDAAAIERATSRIESALTGIGGNLEDVLGRHGAAAGPLAGTALGVAGLFINLRREAALRTAVAAADPLVQDAARALSYLLTPAYIDRLDDRYERLEAALDPLRGAPLDGERYHRAAVKAERAHQRYVALLRASPGLALEAMASAHAALLRALANRSGDLDDTADLIKWFRRRAEAAREAFEDE